MIIEPFHINKTTNFKDLYNYVASTVSGNLRMMGVKGLGGMTTEFTKIFVQSVKTIIQNGQADEFSIYIIPNPNTDSFKILSRFDEVVVEQEFNVDRVEAYKSAMAFNREVCRESKTQNKEDQPGYVRRREKTVETPFDTRFIYEDGAIRCVNGAFASDALRALLSMKIANKAKVKQEA